MYIYMCVCVCFYIYIYIYIYIIHVCVHVYICVCVCVCIYIYIYIYMCVCVCVCIMHFREIIIFERVWFWCKNSKTTDIFKTDDWFIMYTENVCQKDYPYLISLFTLKDKRKTHPFSTVQKFLCKKSKLKNRYLNMY